MSRTFTTYAEHDPDARALVEALPGLSGNVDAYRDTMQRIGQHLAHGILTQLGDSKVPLCVVCTVEDADFLARGVLETLESAAHSHNARLLCLWNARVKRSGVSVSPVLRSYEEPIDADAAIFVVVKSIISGACAVKTNLTRAISHANPARVFIASPVMLIGAEGRLAREFPDEISRRFEFVHYATDTEKDDGGEEIRPGIGGSVYALLGLGDSVSKNRYVPKIVKERRQRFFGATRTV